MHVCPHRPQNAGYLAGNGTNGGYGAKGQWQFDIADYEVFVISDTAGRVPTPPPPTTVTTTTTTTATIASEYGALSDTGLLTKEAGATLKAKVIEQCGASCNKKRHVRRPTTDHACACLCAVPVCPSSTNAHERTYNACGCRQACTNTHTHTRARARTHTHTRTHTRTRTH